MQVRRKIVFVVLGVLFVMGIFIHVRLTYSSAGLDNILFNESQMQETGTIRNMPEVGLGNIIFNESQETGTTHKLPEVEDGLNGPKIQMDDPRVISKIRKKFLFPPSPHTVPYKLKDPTTIDTSMGQAERILSILGHQKGGFFIECGALDGELRSNTLVFERELNWTGLLIEADPLNYAKMVNKNRKAYLSPTCLSIKPYPMLVSFKQNFNVGKISDYPPGYKELNYVDVQCFPLYSYLLALNQTTIDYFSLDVEGNELEVLKTIPFEKLDIRTMSVEYFHVADGKETLQKFVENQGYVLHSEVTHDNNLANDFIFIKSSIADELNSRLV